MAKEFKDFDKKFSREQIKEMRDRYCVGLDSTEEVQDLQKWIHTISQGWKNDYIRFCVYESMSHLYWQQFRVSMKGMSTFEKLVMLHNYGKAHFVNNEDWALRKVEKCRIDNYIGALRRGGQLDENCMVIK